MPSSVEQSVSSSSARRTEARTSRDPGSPRSRRASSASSSRPTSISYACLRATPRCSPTFS
jgi:hypothetical protein